MTPHVTLAAAFAVTFTVLFAGCAPVQMHSGTDRAPGVAYASTGDILLRVNRTDDLPNIFGRADLYGRQRDRGFSEIRYMGITPSGQPYFRRRDVEIVTNETTMSQMGLRLGTASVQATGQGAIASGIGMSASPATVGALPPDTVEFTVNPAQGSSLTVGDHGIQIADFNSAGIHYRIW